MKNILLSTTGTSPQVLTETLYAIHTSGKPFPDEIYVITTRSTRQMLMNGLFRDGHLNALKEEYQLPDFKFTEDHIWLIEDDNGQPIDDAKSIIDQTYMADFITRKVYQLTQKDDVAIHASLAGGRKTMAFYFGYAMSLLGREQDTLSHVFVNDDFEFVRDFWYPTRQPKWIAGKHGQGEVDTSQAVVTLAEIPFVRMRQSVNPQLIESMGNMSFSQTVATLNATHRDDISISIHKKSKTLTLLGLDISLTAKELAFYIWLLQMGDKGLVVDRYFEENKEYAIGFLNTYSEIASDVRVYRTFGIEPEDLKENTLDSLKGMDRTFVQQLRSSINNKLKKILPPDASNKIEIQSKASGYSQQYTVSAHQHQIEFMVV
ncbi:CRISPR-associated ring nuclease Csm6 [Photobacterium sp. J15]|uniref:CRISPR-associated ring nuclease Csm6 n=1 Tax=Photobacterium sp. J15 TaxID=265901 RepID=UPI0007E399E8|nr:CRISPR-associated ring nuclease Csm6 [Photobacterium sp. J15]